MERHVDVAYAVRLRVIAPQSFAQGLAFLLKAEWNYRGVAPKGRRSGPAFETVRHDDPLVVRLVEMHVAVDAARQHQTVCCVDDVVGRPEIMSRRHDASVADGDVASEGIGCGRNRTTADDGVESHVVRLHFLVRRLLPMTTRPLIAEVH